MERDITPGDPVRVKPGHLYAGCYGSVEVVRTDGRLKPVGVCLERVEGVWFYAEDDLEWTYTMIEEEG